MTMRNKIVTTLLLSVMTCAVPAPRPASAQETDGEAAVEQGRQALRRSGDYPWYDAAADDVRRIRVEAPKQRNTTNFSLFGSWDWFTPLAWIVIGLLLAAVIYFLVRMYLLRESRAAQSGQVTEEDAVGDLVDRVEDLPVQLRRPVSDLLAEARRQYEAGNFAEAIIYYYSHQLVQLDRRHLIRLAKGKTNRQYLRELAERSGLLDLLRQTMIVFEDAFFGRHPPSRERFESVWNRQEEFESLMEQQIV